MRHGHTHGRAGPHPTDVGTDNPTPHFASFRAIRRLAIAGAVVATIVSQIGGHIGVVNVERLRLFELVGAAAVIWTVILIILPWERFPISGLMLMSVAATLVVLAAVSLSGGSDSPVWIYYIVIVVFNALYFPPRLAYSLLGVTIAAMMAPPLIAGEGTAVLLESIIALPVYIALTIVASSVSADARVAEQHRVNSATARARLAEADRWADRLEAIQRTGGELHRVTSIPVLGETLLRQTARVVPFASGRFDVLSDGGFLGIAEVDARTDSTAETHSARCSDVTVAIVHDGVKLGRLTLERAATDPFTAADRRLLSIIATFTASAVANSRLFERARYDAERDDLTGLFNRRAGLTKLTEAIVQSRQSGKPLAVCMIDLDGFKACNDRFGHPAGDAVLRDVAQRLLMACRDDDIAARYGGDEFLVVLPESGAASASTMYDRFHDAVTSSSVALGVGVHVTISSSAGIAIFPTDGVSAEALIATADEALYAAKRSTARRQTPIIDGGNPLPIQDDMGGIRVMTG